MIKFIFFLYAVFDRLLKSIFIGIEAGNLVTLKGEKRAGSKCCSGNFILSCLQANVELDTIGDDEINLPGGVILQFQNNVDGNPDSYYYSGSAGEAVFSLNPANPDSIYGHFAAWNGSSYLLEYCGMNGYVWKELDTAKMNELPSLLHDDITYEVDTNEEIVLDDNTTIVEYSVKIYYTAELEADTADLDNFIAQVIDETNQGYINSEIPLRIKSHCPEKLAINESGDANELLNQLKALNNDNYAVTRDGADTAALLVMQLDYCGIAFGNTLDFGLTLSVTLKSCATGYYSFAHEIGHNIGATHNPEASTNTYGHPYGHGHLIQAGNYSEGLRTIMAYNYPGHVTRVNYWSNPAVNHPLTNTSTGVTGISNNAALLTLKRFKLSQIGDETTGSCKVIPPSTIPPTTVPPTTLPPTTAPPTTIPLTTVPPTTQPPIAPSNGEIKCNMMTTSLKRFKSIKRVANEKDCQKECQKMYEQGCEVFNFKKKNCDLLKIVTKKVKGACTGKPYAI